MKHPVFRGFISAVLVLLLSSGCNLKMLDDVSCDGFEADFTFAQDTPCFPPCLVSFSNQVTGGVVREYDWTFGDGGTSTLQNPEHTYNTPGTFPVRLRVVSEESCPDTVTINITINDPNSVLPVAKFSPDDTIGTAHFTVQFSNQSTSATTPSYSWNFGDPGSTSNTTALPSPAHTYEKAGVYTVTLTVTNANGSSTATGTVTVRPRTFAKSFNLDAGSALNEVALLVDEDAAGNFNVVVNTYSLTGTVFGATRVAKFPYDAAASSSNTTVSLPPGLFFHKLSSGRAAGSGFALPGFGIFSPGGTGNDFLMLNVDAGFVSAPSIKTYTDSPGGEETCYGVCEAGVNEYLLCGSKDGSAASDDGMLLIRANPGTGSLTRKKPFTGSTSYIAYDVEKTGTGFMILGVHLNPLTGKDEACLIRINNALDVVGSPKYFGTYFPEKLIRLDDDNFIALVSGISGSGEILKLNFTATNPVAAMHSFSNTLLRAGMIDADGRLVVVGNTRSSPPLTPPFAPLAAKLTVGGSSLGLVWSRGAEEYGNSRELHCLSQTADKGYIFGGVEPGKTLLVRTDADGLVND